MLPRGVVDLAGDLPAADVHMVAPTATLVAREGLHPALAQLFVQAAQQVHGEPGWFQRKGDFPNAHDGERPLAAEAQRFYRNGVPLLQRYLPFWMANLIDRMWLAHAVDRRGADPAVARGAAAGTSSASARASSAGMAACARSRTAPARARHRRC